MKNFIEKFKRFTKRFWYYNPLTYGEPSKMIFFHPTLSMMDSPSSFNIYFQFFFIGIGFVIKFKKGQII